jgi:hypothetical protein
MLLRGDCDNTIRSKDIYSCSFPFHERKDVGPKRNEVTGEWRKLHNEELRDLYSSPSIIRLMKSRRMRLAGHIARVGERRNA